MSSSGPTSTTFTSRRSSPSSANAVRNAAAAVDPSVSHDHYTSLYGGYDDLSMKIIDYQRTMVRFAWAVTILLAWCAVVLGVLLGMLFVRTKTLDDDATLAQDILTTVREILDRLMGMGVLEEVADTLFMWKNETKPFISKIVVYGTNVIIEVANNQTMAVAKTTFWKIASTSEYALEVVTRLATIFQVPSLAPPPP